MIERLIAAQGALDAGDLDHAARLFGQVADADPRNAIAVVGLAEVARRLGREAEAATLVDRALAIDPDDEAARRMLASPGAAAAGDAAPEAAAPGAAAPEASGASPRGATPQVATPVGAPPLPDRSILGWLKRLLGRSARRTP